MHTLLSAIDPQQANNTWPIIASVAGLFAGTIGALILYNLQMLKASLTDIIKRQDAQAAEIKQLMERRQTCQQDFVGKVEYIRSTNTLETGMKDLTKAVAELAGTMKVIEQMPKICGAIARDIVKEMQNNG